KSFGRNCKPLNQTVKIQRKHLREYIALSLVPKIGAQRIRLLLQKVNHPQEIFRMNRSTLEQIEGIGPVLADAVLQFNNWDRVDKILEQTEKTGAQIITYQDEAYPKLLREIYDPPVLFWLKGDPEVLNLPGIAVVGTRRATDYGIEKARDFTGELIKSGLTIVSGLAYGVDSAAHQATLKSGGKTIAVLGSGIDNIYPSKNYGLAQEIAESGGAVISEFPLGTKPDMGNFPVRNRIVSGMTLGTLVIESGLKGGSMITAQSALTQNREVFVVPHSLENKNGVGCNHLIKRGAGKLVQSVQDILEEIPARDVEESAETVSKEPQWKSLELDDLSVSICESLEENPLHIDELAENLDMKSHILLSKLLELEMQECVRQTAGKNFELIG
ncbi:MAG TPA: DNA-processing protein DprA, partial [Balneolaceae bacterium]